VTERPENSQASVGSGWSTSVGGPAKLLAKARLKKNSEAHLSGLAFVGSHCFARAPDADAGTVARWSGWSKAARVTLGRRLSMRQTGPATRGPGRGRLFGRASGRPLALGEDHLVANSGRACHPCCVANVSNKKLAVRRANWRDAFNRECVRPNPSSSPRLRMVGFVAGLRGILLPATRRCWCWPAALGLGRRRSKNERCCPSAGRSSAPT